MTATLRDDVWHPKDLRRALERLATQASPASPLAPLLAAPASDAGRGQGPPLDAEWTRAIATLARPVEQISWLAPAPGIRLTPRSFYRRSAGDSRLVGCWAERGGVRIAFPWTAADILQVSLAAVDAGSTGPAARLDVRLGPSGLAVVAAAVDVLRRRLLLALLERRADVSTELELEDLSDEISAALSTTDPRGLTTLVHLLSPSGVDGSRRAIEAGVAELVEHELLRAVQRRYLADQRLQFLTARLKNPLPAISHERVALAGGSRVVQASKVTVRGDGPLLVFDFEQNGGPIHLHSVDIATYAAELATLIDGDGAAATAAAPRPSAARQESVGAAAPRPRARPATVERPSPTSQDKARPARCAACGTAATAGDHFCSTCGASLRETPDVSPASRAEPAATTSTSGRRTRPLANVLTAIGVIGGSALLAFVTSGGVPELALVGAGFGSLAYLALWLLFWRAPRPGVQSGDATEASSPTASLTGERRDRRMRIAGLVLLLLTLGLARSCGPDILDLFR